MKTSGLAHYPENSLRIVLMPPNHNGNSVYTNGTFVPLPSVYLPGQVGKPGAQSGTGLLAVADWWLGRMRLDEDETEAAATPTRTIERAKMRIASFMIGNPFRFEFAEV